MISDDHKTEDLKTNETGRQDGFTGLAMSDNTGIEVIDMLNRFFNISRISAETYRQAALDVDTEDLKLKFSTYAQQRTMFVIRLGLKLNALGAKLEDRITEDRLGTPYNLWHNVKSAIKRGDEHAVLVECERAESAMLNTYSAALQMSLPGDVQDTLASQYLNIEQVRNHIQKMKKLVA
jgi:uncharacterized protein (TIGR02284 family)